LPEIAGSGTTSTTESPLFVNGMQFSVQLQNWRQDTTAPLPILPTTVTPYHTGSRVVTLGYATVADQEVADPSALSWKTWNVRFPDDLGDDGFLTLQWGTWND